MWKGTLPGFQEALAIPDEVQISVEDLEARTRLRFEVLRDNDHLASGGDLATLEILRTDTGTVAELPIKSYDDIVV